MLNTYQQGKPTMNVIRINQTTVAIDGVVYVIASVKPSKKNDEGLPGSIIRAIERAGPLSHGVVMNRMRHFQSADVDKFLSDLVAQGKLCKHVSIHKYTHKEILTYTLPETMPETMPGSVSV